MVMDTLQRINREDGITIIASLHNLATARGYCDRIIGMSEGRVVFDGAPAELTPEIVCAIYGVEGAREELGEMVACSSQGASVRPVFHSVAAHS